MGDDQIHLEGSGPLQGARGLNPQDQIAQSYQDDLDGSNGPTRRMEAIQELSRLAMTDRLRSLVSEIESLLDREPEDLARNQALGDEPLEFERPREIKRYWDLAVVDSTVPSVKISQPGKLKASAAIDATDEVSITSIGSTFTVANGDYLVIEIDTTLAATLKVLTSWTGHPYLWETSLDGSGFRQMDKFFIPLWKIVTVATDTSGLEGLAIDGALKAARLVPMANLRLTMNVHEDTNDGQAVSVLNAVPDFGLL